VEVLVERCAGIDVGKNEVVVCVRTPAASGRGRQKQTRTFASFTGSLEAMADWLAAEGVTEIAMEATGSYWKPVWYVLEERAFALKLVNAPPGRASPPGNNITGGKRGSGKTTKGDVWLLDILTQCAWAAARAHDTYLSAQFWRLARRIGKKKATIAVAHSILVICWHLLTNDCDYDDLGGDWFTRRNTDRQRDRLIQQLAGLGYYVTLDKIA
jgi:transposase